MAGDHPIRKGDGPMTKNGLARSTDHFDDSEPTGVPELAPRAVPLGGRRISFTAWGLASLAGIALWVLFFKLV